MFQTSVNISAWYIRTHWSRSYAWSLFWSWSYAVWIYHKDLRSIAFKVNNGQDDILTIKWKVLFLFRTFDDEGFKHGCWELVDKLIWPPPPPRPPCSQYLESHPLVIFVSRQVEFYFTWPNWSFRKIIVTKMNDGAHVIWASLFSNIGLLIRTDKLR